MNARKFLLGTVAAAGVAFLLSFMWHVLLMGDFYDSAASGTLRDPPFFSAIILGYVVVGLIMAYLYPKVHGGGSPLSEGLKFGVLVGLLWWFPTNLVLYGAMEGPFSIVLVDGIWHLFEEGIAGAVLGLVMAPVVKPD